MKLSIKAALLSGLVFPGAGYFIVRKKITGLIIFILTCSGLSALIVDTTHKAKIIAEKINQGVIPLDINIIQEQIHITPGVFSANTLIGISVIIGLLWIVGVADCYRIGKNI